MLQDQKMNTWLSVRLKKVCLNKLDLFYSNSLLKPDVKREIMLMKNGLKLPDNVDDNIIYFLLKLKQSKEPEKKNKIINLPLYHPISRKQEPEEFCTIFDPKVPPNRFKTWESARKPDHAKISEENKSVKYKCELDLEFCLVKGDLQTIGNTGMALNESVSKYKTPILLEFLSQLKPNKKTGMSYLAEIYDLVLKLDPQPSTEIKSLLLIIVQDACVPLFAFIDNWLLEGTLDPYQEFFIKRIDGAYAFDHSLELPAFLDREFAEKIFRTGNWNRLFSDVSVHSFYEKESDLAQTLNDLDIGTEWVIHPQEIIEYKSNLMEQQKQRLAYLCDIQQSLLKKPTKEQKLSEQLKEFIYREQNLNELKTIERLRIAKETKDAKIKLKKEIDEFIESQNNYKKQKQKEEEERNVLKVDANFERMLKEEKIKLEKEYLDKMAKIDAQIAIIDSELYDLGTIEESVDLKSEFLEIRKGLTESIRSEWKSDSNNINDVQPIENIVPGSVVDNCQNFDADQNSTDFDSSRRFDESAFESVCDFEPSMLLDQVIEERNLIDSSPEFEINIESVQEKSKDNSCKCDTDSITTLDFEKAGTNLEEPKLIIVQDAKEDLKKNESETLSKDWYYDKVKPTLLEKFEYKTQEINERRTKTLQVLLQYSQDYIPIIITTSTFLLSIQNQITFKNKSIMTKISSLNVIHNFELIYKYFLFGSGTFLQSILHTKLSNIEIEYPLTLDYLVDNIHLDFKMQKPLDLIITKRSLKKLKACFEFLTNVFKTRKALNEIYGKGFDIKKDLMCMSGFICGVVLYLQVTIEKEWISFRDAAYDDGSLSVDDLIELYHGFVDVVYRKLLLDKEKLMELIVDYLVVLRKLALELAGGLQKESRGYLVSTGRVLHKNLVRLVEEEIAQGAALEEFKFFIKQ